MSRPLILWLFIALLVMVGCQQPPSPSAAPPEPTAATAPEAPPTTPPTEESADDAESVPSESSAIPEVTFSAFEYYFEGPESIESGETRIVLDNQGEAAHQFLLAKLDDGKTIDDVNAAIEAGEATPEWATMYGGVLAMPGTTTSYVTNLTPGNYVYFSFWNEEDTDPPDVARGMISTFTVTEGDVASTGEVHEADLTVTMQDFAFALSGPVQAGEQVIQIKNQGQESHHLVVFRINEGATFGDFHHYFASEEPPQGPPPADIYGFLGEHSPDIDAYYTMNFTPGVYAFICFLPSMAHEGATHFALGMMQEVIVE